MLLHSTEEDGAVRGLKTLLSHLTVTIDLLHPSVQYASVRTAHVISVPIFKVGRSGSCETEHNLFPAPVWFYN